MLPSLISSDCLRANIDNPALKIIDASWHMPTTGRDPALEFDERHIQNAIFFDIDAIADSQSHLPHMMPDEGVFSQMMSALGISKDDHVVIYDDSDIHSGLRAWWMFRTFGHQGVSYLDGGFARWMNGGNPVTSTRTVITPSQYQGNLDTHAIWQSQDMFDNIGSAQRQIIDARPYKRFTAEVAEPRAGLRSGHIPDSISVPADTLFQKNGCFHDKDSIEKIFQKAGTDFTRSLVTSCGSGVTACVLLMGLHLIGKNDVSVYDGSWTEWGSLSDKEAPVVTGDM